MVLSIISTVVLIVGLSRKVRKHPLRNSAQQEDAQTLSSFLSLACHLYHVYQKLV